MTIDEAVNLLTVKHLENKVKKWVRDPVAYTLYEVWRIADSKVTYHPSNLQQTCNHVATNADGLRAMNNEELADYHAKMQLLGEYGVDSEKTELCKKLWLDWLQSPAGGDENGS